MRPNGTGFTIVELLIVIVVVAILAAIVIVAYNGVQGRSRDSRRAQDMNTIVKALEIHKTKTGSYPGPNITANASGWEVSTTGNTATNFLSALKSSTDGVSNIPVDPTNTGDSSNLNPTWSSNSRLYFYYKYNAGQNGCDTAKGDYYVLGVTRFDSIGSGQAAPNSPGFSCNNGSTSRNWQTNGAWVTGGYTN